ncbi:hypothetical protein CYMTET_7973 [Cymbomonas tetramitiformis]|uniref:Uncharacterized protein n=1 Tax=Cymbomonas tetramitiformis TaxID=36881 RepID=A0AAE0LGG2_9CHLO|nr:hypothetical protein CYMTET_7973 [Cymbomonas tetramitiformis]
MVEKGKGEMEKAKEKQEKWVETMGLPSTPESFTDFVRMINQKLSSGSSAAFPGSLCSINRHLCSQVSGCTEEGKKITMLKLELQPKWFPCFAHTLGIGKDELEGDQWQIFAGKPCFYSPTKNCSDWAKVDESPKMAADHDHATSATSHITEHYTPEAARLVSEIYSDDIATLGYPKWDGESPFEMV